MSFSLNETDALCRKAARGAGHTWGHAEDAGRAVRWLQAHGIAGAEGLLHCLQDTDGKPRTLTLSGSDWRGDGGLCPIIAGASLSDHAASLADHPVILHDVRHPILLAPFAAAIATQTCRSVSLTWAGTRLTLPATATFLDDSKTLHIRTATVTCTLTDDPAQPDPALQTRADLAPDIYDKLSTFAQRTYAPATEASRTTGAGSSQSDND